MNFSDTVISPTMLHSFSLTQSSAAKLTQVLKDRITIVLEERATLGDIKRVIQIKSANLSISITINANIR